MPLFRFDLQRNDGPWSQDEDGLELPSDEDARREAMTMLGEMAKDHILQVRSLAIRIWNSEPEPLTTLRLSFQSEERS